MGTHSLTRETPEPRLLTPKFVYAAVWPLIIIKIVTVQFQFHSGMCRLMGYSHWKNCWPTNRPDKNFVGQHV